MTTFVNLRTQCSVRFRDTAFKVVTDAQWKNYVNQAYQQVNRKTSRWPWMESAIQSVGYTTGVRQANLPTDVVQVNSVYDATNARKLDPMEGRAEQIRYAHLLTETGLPEAYKLNGSTIELYPLPQTDGQLSIECVTMPVKLSGDSDEPVWPEHFHEVLVPGALALAYLDDGNADWYNINAAQFKREADEMMNSILAFRTESMVPIRDTFWDNRF